jgi:hypothetical protein
MTDAAQRRRAGAVSALDEHRDPSRVDRSLTVVLAIRATERGHRRATVAWLGASIALGLAFAR